MTTFYASASDGVDNAVGAVALGDAAVRSGKVHAVTSVIDLAAKTVLNGDTIVWGRLPKGAVPLVALLVTGTSLGSATIDLGTNATAAKFKAAGTFTATDTPTPFMKSSAIGVAEADARVLQSVIATANLPTTGKLAVVFLYTTPHSG